MESLAGESWLWNRGCGILGYELMGGTWEASGEHLEASGGTWEHLGASGSKPNAQLCKPPGTLQ